MLKRTAQAADGAQRPTKRARRDEATTPSRAQASAKSAGIPTNTAHLNDIPPRQLQVFVFGDGEAGELGLGPKNSTGVKRPRANPNLAHVRDIATGGMHGVAVLEGGSLVTWGVNDEYALGRDTTWDGGVRDMDEGSDDDSDAPELNPNEATPMAVPVPADNRIVQVAAGDSATFYLTSQGEVWGCGIFRDGNGKFGFSYDFQTRTPCRDPEATDKDHELNQRDFVRIPGLHGIVSICAGADFALALDSQGQVFAWGPGEQGQLGRRIVQRRRFESLVPARVGLPRHTRVRSIFAGIDHAFAIDSNGETWAWGLNNFAQTGIADMAGRDGAIIGTPHKVASLSDKNMKMIAGGRHHSIGITADGECLAWGRIDGGQSGLDLMTLDLEDSSKVVLDERRRPRILLEPTALPMIGCVFVASGPDHSLVVTEDGRAWSWGFNAGGQCGQGTEDDVNIAKLIEGKAIKDVKLCWAGAGGQYSMVACSVDDAQS